VSYAALIDRQVVSAFNKVKDLAVDATFTKALSATFDFNAGTLSKTSDTPVTIKLIELDQKKPQKNSNTITKTVMVKAIDVGSLSLYDTLSYSGNTWRIGDALKETGRVWIFNIFREV